MCRRRRGAAEEHALGVAMPTREALRTSNPRANVETTAEIIATYRPLMPLGDFFELFYSSTPFLAVMKSKE